MDIAALHFGGQVLQHLVQFLLVFSLFFRKLQGSYEPSKTGALRNDGQVDHLQSCTKNDRQKGAAEQGKDARSAHSNPVVLRVEGFFYVVDVFLRSLRAGLILDVGSSHLDTHPHLSAAGSATQTAENIVRQVVKLIALFQA